MDFKPFKIGKYLLLERLAVGGMAEVYRAKASGAGGFEKQLAIKRILPTYSANEEFRRMFEYEARLSSQLTHANIVQIYDFVKAGDTYLLAMEYVDGKNLRQFVNKLKKTGFMPPIEFGVYIINEVCKGLEYAHSKKDDLNGKPLNVIHRDMSPQNIMISYDGAVKIVDFGIAKAKDRVDETRSGVIKGKFGYMSPEQANGEPVDHRSDIFSTGIILWELLTGKRLFAAENDMATLKQIQECIIMAPSKLNPKVNPDLEKIVMKALTKDLKLRYQSAGIFNRNLQEHLNKYFPSFTQKEIQDIFQRTFQEEIAAERRRFEQVVKQPIPYSGGLEKPKGLAANLEDEDPDAGDAASDGDITKSESSGNTAITNFDEIEENAEEGQSVSDFADLSVSGEVEIDDEPQSRSSEKSNAGKTKIESVIEDDDLGSFPSSASIKTERGPTGSRTVKGTGRTPAVPKQRTSVSINPDDDLTPTGAKGSSTGKKGSLSDASSLLLDNSADMTGSRRRERSISAATEISRSANGDISLAKIEPENARGLDVRGESPSRGRNRGPARYDERPDDYLSAPRKTSGLRNILVMILVIMGGIYYLKNNDISGIPTIVKPSGPRDPATNTSTTSKGTETVTPKGEVGECAVAIGTDPQGAKVIFNGVERGVTNTTVSGVCGSSVQMTVSLDGYEAVVESLTLKDRELKFYRSLKRIPSGTLEVILNQNANVYVDGELVGSATANLPFEKVLRSGKKYKVKFVNEVYGIEDTREFSIETDVVTRKTIKLGERSN